MGFGDKFMQLFRRKKRQKNPNRRSDPEEQVAETLSQDKTKAVQSSTSSSGVRSQVGIIAARMEGRPSTRTTDGPTMPAKRNEPAVSERRDSASMSGMSTAEEMQSLQRQTVTYRYLDSTKLTAFLAENFPNNAKAVVSNCFAVDLCC